jgi:hypothetical protein
MRRFLKLFARPAGRRRPALPRPHVVPLEDRLLLSTYWVSTTGSDSNPGTSTQPFATIQHGLDTASQPGDTVEVYGGVYNEKVAFHYSGSATGGYITLTNVQGQNPVIDGTGLGSSDVGYGNDMVQMHNISYVKLIGFEIRNDQGLSDQNDGSGVRIQGHGSNVQILNNVIHDITGTGGAMGITVYGTNLTQALSNVIIDSNQVYNCDPGNSEALTLNGNVNNFQVTYNTVHDVNNIGIDMIGGECDIFGLTHQQTGLPVTRNGTCSHNTVSNANSGDPVNNPAGGIYVDGGKNITLADNVSHNNDLGIEVAAENAGYTATGCVVENCIIYHNLNAGLAFGGYQQSVGRTRHCSFINNTLYQNDTDNIGNGQLWIQWGSYNTVTNNILVASANDMLIASWDPGSNHNNLLDHNLFFAPGGAGAAGFSWNGTSYTGFNAYRNGTGEDAHSLFGDPLFVNAGAADFHLTSSSPAIRAGSSVSGQYSTQDFDGVTRTLPPDIGAYQYVPQGRVRRRDFGRPRFAAWRGDWGFSS